MVVCLLLMLYHRYGLGMGRITVGEVHVVIARGDSMGEVTPPSSPKNKLDLLKVRSPDPLIRDWVFRFLLAQLDPPCSIKQDPPFFTNETMPIA